MEQIELPDNFTTDIASSTTLFLGNFSGYITFVLGIIVSLLVIRFLISAILKH